MADHLMATYAPLPVAFTHGEGAWVYDTEGGKYLDALCGIAVTGLGHNHPAVTDAVCRQAGRLLHTSNIYRIPAQAALADRLSTLSGMDRVFFGNSGAEAVEAALKIARRFGHAKGVDVPCVVVMDNSFHGRTLATLSATGNAKVKVGFEPLLPCFVRVPFDDLEAVASVARQRDDVVAVLVEPVQGEGGIRVPDGGYLAGLRALCDEHGWLLMLDEIQTACGRTGEWFAFRHEAVEPDVMTLAKGLANGVPIGACLARGEAAELLGTGSHGSTFGGNPLACSAALAVLDSIEEGDLVRRAGQLGSRMLEALREGLADLDFVTEVRGKGLMLGIELDRPAGELVTRALNEGLLINVTAEKVVRLLPPLILEDSEADLVVDKVIRLVRELVAPSVERAARG
jgi:acetylornithine/N-succinyldiaminopimelate aminotransferase